MEQIVLFGSGKLAEEVYKVYAKNIIAVIDNNEEKQGKEFKTGIPIISLDQYIHNYAQNSQIYITSLKYGKDMINQLNESGITNYKIPAEIWKDPNVITDSDIAHGNWINYLKKLCDKSGNNILEVGSRVVTGECFKNVWENANYTGFDLYEGENVDVSGDAHCLSQYFDQKFDLIYTSACFEHFAMPWQVSLEMIKCLKVGGYIFVETHYSYSSHERPWHFFQFSENALNVLFPEKFGMKCVKKGCSNLLKGVFSEEASPYLRGQFVTGLYCHSEILLQKVANISNEELDWSRVSMGDVVGSTRYPQKRKKS